MASIREERKSQIIQAAMEVFGEKGYHKAKIEEIAERADIGKSTVYEYFDSKRHLFEEMLRFLATEYKEDVAKSVSSTRGCRERLLAYSRNHGSFIKNHMELVETTMSDSSSVSDEIKKEMLRYKLEVMDMVEMVLKEGVGSGELRKDLDTRLATSIILGAINENYAIEVVVHGKKPEDIDPEPVVDIMFRGMGMPRRVRDFSTSSK